MANHFAKRKGTLISSQLTAYAVRAYIIIAVYVLSSRYRVCQITADSSRSREAWHTFTTFSRAATRFSVGTQSLVLHIRFLIYFFCSF